MATHVGPKTPDMRSLAAMPRPNLEVSLCLMILDDLCKLYLPISGFVTRFLWYFYCEYLSYPPPFTLEFPPRSPPVSRLGPCPPILIIPRIASHTRMPLSQEQGLHHYQCLY